MFFSPKVSDASDQEDSGSRVKVEKVPCVSPKPMLPIATGDLPKPPSSPQQGWISFFKIEIVFG